MRFNGIITDLISTPTGIPRGSPLSPILYILYNCDLLGISKRGKQIELGFIDDILYRIQNKTANSELERFLIRSEQWRKRHGAQFEKSKICANTFHGNRIGTSEASITIGETTIHPSSEAKYLGIIFDQKLKFRSHVEQIVRKETKYALAKSRWGPEFKYLSRHMH